MTKPTFRLRFGYWFDNLMSRGTPALIGGLAVATLGIIFTAGLIVALGGRFVANPDADPPGFLEATWWSLTPAAGVFAILAELWLYNSLLTRRRLP